MSNIFVSQYALRIQLTVNQDIAGALTKKIFYRRPDGTEGSWTALVSDAATGVIYYDLTADTELPIPGDWRFWSYIEFSDGRKATGDAVEQRVYGIGNN